MHTQGEAIVRQLQGCNSHSKLLKIHANSLTSGLILRHPSILNSLLAFSAGSLSHALLLFRHHIPFPPLPLHWNLLIRGLSSSHHPRQAILCYNTMLGLDIGCWTAFGYVKRINWYQSNSDDRTTEASSDDGGEILGEGGSEGRSTMGNGKHKWRSTTGDLGGPGKDEERYDNGIRQAKHGCRSNHGGRGISFRSKGIGVEWIRRIEITKEPMGEARVRRLEIPVFDGSGFESWVVRSKRYFSVS